MHTIFGKRLLMLKPSQIKLSSDRIRQQPSNMEIKTLADSIAVNGIIEPLAVRKNEDGVYILISGQRRLRAAVAVGLRRVPCVLHKVEADKSSIYSLNENIQRKPLDFFEEAEAFERLITLHKMGRHEIIMNLGISEFYLSGKLGLLKLGTDIRNRIRYAELSEDFARALLMLPEYQHQEVLDEIISEGLDIDDTKELIDLKLNPKTQEEEDEEKEEPEEIKPVRKFSIADVRFFANSLNKLVETLQNAGIKATIRKTENGKSIEYKVKIIKEKHEEPEFAQLRLKSV